ncbi:hypothetical protein [Pantoea agglomerans]|uniref:hypothetical protein n=1 Tax=Enterobacter agglomerans TaxID=549 RepID=UPI00315ACA88
MHSLRRITYITLAVTALVGCIPGPKSTVLKSAEFLKPHVGETATVYMGDPVIKSANGFKADALRLGFAKGTYSIIAAGTYCNIGDHFYQNTQNPSAVTFTDVAGNPTLRLNYVAYDPVKNTVSPPGGYAYSSKEISITRLPEAICLQENSFVRTIEYNGNAGGVLKFTYREFSNDMARSAYTTDFTIDSSEGNTVTYKGARIKVVKADNSSITYTVLSGFDSASQF